MRVLVITGAGISAESGIPTFRGKGGYWRNLDPTKLATPEAFAENPSLVWEWYNERRKWIREAEPNPAHYAVVDLANGAGEFLLVTQNVDDLHARAGLSREKMVQVHGDIFETRCSQCRFIQDDSLVRLDGLKPSSLTTSAHIEGRGDLPGPPGRSGSIAPASGAIPKCAKCRALMRPGVIWFGEQLDPRKIDMVEKFLDRGPCDLTLVIGTTALFGYIIDWATRPAGKLIEINPDETPLSRLATESIREPAGGALPRLIKSLFP